jgi:hypothetical protein
MLRPPFELTRDVVAKMSKPLMNKIENTAFMYHKVTGSVDRELVAWHYCNNNEAGL